MDAPYSKREQDEFRRENREQYENIMNVLKERKVYDDKQAKIIADLCRIVSHSSGQITALWKAHEENKKATELIKDITAVWKAGKWFVYLIIGLSALIVAVKTIITVGFNEGLLKLKHLFY